MSVWHVCIKFREGGKLEFGNIWIDVKLGMSVR
jgi:hypothetical protein